MSMTDGTQTATCVALIMDGNRRWAKERQVPSLEGHAAGLAKAKEIVRHAFSRGVETAVLYAFSTENWNRSKEEVGYLLDLFATALMRDIEELSREGIRVRFIGDLARLPEHLRLSMERLERTSAGHRGKTFIIAISYGGRAELAAAVNRLLARGVSSIREEDITTALWSADMPDPDIIIRTGGEKRLSNFLPWQSVYSELFFTDTKWPAFTTEEFDGILAEFSARERRRGK